MKKSLMQGLWCSMWNKPEDLDMPLGGEMDLGDPIASLAKFKQGTSDGFGVGVRRSIQRRTVVVQLTSFAVIMPLVVLREFCVLFDQRFNSPDARKGFNHEGTTY
jgi:hypothetical protein